MLSGSIVDGKVELKYLDFFDSRPKEDIDSFMKKLRHFALKNKEPKFFHEEDAENLINQVGRYYDGHAYSRIYAIELAHNRYLER